MATEVQRQKVMDHARRWEDYANVQLNFGDDPDAEIRISFQADPGSWSAIGTDCLITEYFPQVPADDEFRLAHGRHR